MRWSTGILEGALLLVEKQDIVGFDTSIDVNEKPEFQVADKTEAIEIEYLRWFYKHLNWDALVLNDIIRKFTQETGKIPPEEYRFE